MTANNVSKPLTERKPIDFGKKLKKQIPRGYIRCISYENDDVSVIHDIATFEVPVKGKLPKKVRKYFKNLKDEFKSLKEIDINLDLFVEYRLTDKE